MVGFNQFKLYFNLRFFGYMNCFVSPEYITQTQKNICQENSLPLLLSFLSFNDFYSFQDSLHCWKFIWCKICMLKCFNMIMVENLNSPFKLILIAEVHFANHLKTTFGIAFIQNFLWQLPLLRYLSFCLTS